MTPVEELQVISNDAATALKELKAPKFQGILRAIGDAADDIGRAWSRSNIGYHARVYCDGLHARHPNLHFSAEWGLQDEWPTHTPNEIWKVYDHDAIIEEILRRAGRPSVEDLNKKVTPLRDKLYELKEAAISVLTSVSSGADDFIKRKLDQIQRLDPADVTTIVNDMMPGSAWSRDTLAMTEGIRPAPHQCMAAIPAAMGALESALNTVSKASNEAATHLKRNLGQPAVQKGKKKIFIGHGRSHQWRELKDFIVDRVKLPFNEFNTTSAAGVATTARLSELLDDACFAFLVMTAEDETAEGKLIARLNVIHEVGLFQGRLGFDKAIVLLEDGCEEFSNIHGLGQIRFPRGQIMVAFEEVRRVLERERIIVA